jgi:uncharacterized lipoprotein YddW (UPF0748 family)
MLRARSLLTAASLTLLVHCGAPPSPSTDGAADDGTRRADSDVIPDGALDALDVALPLDADPDAAPDAPEDVTSDVPIDAGPTLVRVSHAREFRGVWVATVTNIDWPSRTGLSATTQQNELIAMLDTMVRLNLNVMVFQVRPEGDALYRSTLEPWSRFLSGTQGRDPGYDPLAFLVTEAHRRGIEVHAWFNPYRAKTTTASIAVAPHISVTNPEVCVTYDGKLWMDPGRTLVQDRAVNVVLDVVRRYDIDGVHFDDYFYPYPAGTDFPDQATYDAYRMGGGTLNRGDWRRDNVNRLVRRVHDSILAVKDHVRFGISPFGIYRPGMPPGITGLDQYASIYADPLRWMQQGWVEYLAPQLYWPTTQTAQAYEPLLRWWTGITTDGRYIFVGNYLSRLGSSSAWSVDEFRAQMDITRRYRAQGAMGNIFFTIDPFQSNRMGIADVFRREYYQRPALTPPLAPMRGASLSPPDVVVEGRTVRVSHAGTTPMRAWVVYAEQADGTWAIDRIVPAAQASFSLPAGRWAVSAASRHGVESLGVPIEVR